MDGLLRRARPKTLINILNAHVPQEISGHFTGEMETAAAAKFCMQKATMYVFYGLQFRRNEQYFVNYNDTAKLALCNAKYVMLRPLIR